MKKKKLKNTEEKEQFILKEIIDYVLPKLTTSYAA
jgi:hypothetical protein